MNSSIAECSHVDCPNRRRAWSDRPSTSYRAPWTAVDKAPPAEGDPLPLDKAIKRGKR